MTDSMNFGPEWLRNLSSDGSTSGGTGGVRYQLAEFRYGREEMLALFDKSLRPPSSLCSFTTLYAEQTLPPLALQPTTEDERMWQPRAPPVGGMVRGRGGSLERGGRGTRGRGSYQPYGRSGAFESGGGWGNSEQSEWGPRKDYNSRSSSVDNWRRNRGEEEEAWRSSNPRVGEKWGRSTSWRDGDATEERGSQDRNRSWHEVSKSHPQRRMWDEDHLPEWATENLGEGGGTFDATGAFHGSDDETVESKGRSDGDCKESPLQKSVSQQNITHKNHPAILPSSLSASSLTSDNKREVETNSIKKSEPKEHETSMEMKIEKVVTSSPVKPPKREASKKSKPGEPSNSVANINGVSHEFSSNNRVEEEFDRLQEDLVLKLVEEPTKSPHINNVPPMGVGITTQPPPNLAPPIQDKWFYQDPQGDLQGPFLSTEMAEWFRAGYFNTSLLVRRQCDERFYMLGDLVSICNGGNPFQTSMRVPPLKPEPPKLPEQDLIQLQIMQAQLALRQASTRVFNPGEPWANLSPIQQRELLAQQMLSQPQMPPDLQFLQQPPNPLLQMFNQINQANKNLPEKAPTSIPVPLDPIQALVQQMGGLQSLQGRLPVNPGILGNPAGSQLPGGNVIPGASNVPTAPNMATASGIPGLGLPPSLQNDSHPANLSGMHNTLPPSGLSIGNMQNLPGGLAGNLQNSLPPKSTLGNVEPLVDNNPINNLLRQFANKSQTQQRDLLWQHNQFVGAQVNPQWQQQQQEVPMSMWDMQTPKLESNSLNAETQSTADEIVTKPKEKNKDIKDSAKEDKKKRELEEKQAKKEAEEKRKQEQRKQEAEKKASEEKRKKEEERVKRELEKAKREAEEKRLRELEEKRKQKELRKAEEEARKKAEELKRMEDEERERYEAQEREELTRKQAEAARQAHENQIKLTKIAPWCQSNTSQGASLADIQKAEREKRAEQAAILQQQKVKLEQEPVVEKPVAQQFSWAHKPILPRQVKSLAEIQAEEQDRLAKQVAEARLVQQQKEKDTVPTVNPGIWNGQNLTWANNTSQWSNPGGFWDESLPVKLLPVKPMPVVKSNSNSVVNQPKPTPPKPVKVKAKKEEQQVVKAFNNNNTVTDEFMNWCTKALTNLNSTVDIPTFVSFLRDIESALDVREYCRDYLGDAPGSYQFASQFLEKRRSFKPKNNAHKDDMCSPAPAITPSSHSDFQEVKTKGKKTKKSKMLKVDARILGFNVTASHDRINVGDRDYVDN